MKIQGTIYSPGKIAFTQTRSLQWLLFYSWLGMCGCDVTKPNTVTDLSQLKSTLIDESDSVYEFADVLRPISSELVHKYLLTNTTKKPIKILRLINRKTCCGDVKISSNIILCGESVVAEVTLNSQSQQNELIHTTEIDTDCVIQPKVVLETRVRTFPRLAIVDADSPKFTQSKKKGSHTVALKVIAYGTADETPVNLNRVIIESNSSANWLGTKVIANSSDHMNSDTRILILTLDLSQIPGEKTIPIVFKNDNQLILTHLFRYEITRALIASPKAAIFTKDQRQVSILITSRDLIPFKIIALSTDAIGINFEASDATPRTTHVVKIRSTNTLLEGTTRNKLTVSTDHPSQQQIEVQLLELNETRGIEQIRQ